MVRSPLTAARATFALKAGEWFRRVRLLMVSPVHGDYRRCQAETPLIVLFRFPGPALTSWTGCARSWRQGFHLDHRIARNAGGSNDASNLHWLCHGCHRKTVKED